MRIMGVDPGLVATGYGLVELAEDFRLDCRAAGVIRPDSTELAARLAQIHRELARILRELQPEVMAVENLYTTYNHPMTAVLMGHARGVIFLAAAELGVPVVGYAPTELKRAITGHGRASKAQVQAMVQRLLRLPERPAPDHVADALALAICHAHRARGQRQPITRNSEPGTRNYL